MSVSGGSLEDRDSRGIVFDDWNCIFWDERRQIHVLQCSFCFLTVHIPLKFLSILQCSVPPFKDQVLWLVKLGLCQGPLARFLVGDWENSCQETRLFAPPIGEDTGRRVVQLMSYDKWII